MTDPSRFRDPRSNSHLIHPWELALLVHSYDHRLALKEAQSSCLARAQMALRRAAPLMAELFDRVGPHHPSYEHLHEPRTLLAQLQQSLTDQEDIIERAFPPIPTPFIPNDDYGILRGPETHVPAPMLRRDLFPRSRSAPPKTVRTPESRRWLHVKGQEWTLPSDAGAAGAINSWMPFGGQRHPPTSWVPSTHIAPSPLSQAHFYTIGTQLHVHHLDYSILRQSRQSCADFYEAQTLFWQQANHQIGKWMHMIQFCYRHLHADVAEDVADGLPNAFLYNNIDFGAHEAGRAMGQAVRLLESHQKNPTWLNNQMLFEAKHGHPYMPKLTRRHSF